MDVYSWNDFNNNKKWPESMVAKYSNVYNIITYEIKEYINE